MQQHDHGPRIRPHCYTTAEIYCPDAVTLLLLLLLLMLLLLRLFHKIPALILVDVENNYLNKTPVQNTP